MTPEQLAKSGSESAHQKALFCQAALHYNQYPELKWMHAIPNGGMRSARTGANMKAEGARAGVLDIFLPVSITTPIGATTSGLYIEMKKPGFENRKNGGMSDKQVEFSRHAMFFGYRVRICYTWEQAWEQIIGYLENVSEEQRGAYHTWMEAQNG